jgi:hypothetical protein
LPLELAAKHEINARIDIGNRPAVHLVLRGSDLGLRQVREEPEGMMLMERRVWRDTVQPVAKGLDAVRVHGETPIARTQAVPLRMMEARRALQMIRDRIILMP